MTTTFTIASDGVRTIDKAPGAGPLDYTFDWSAWLQAGETISTKNVTLSPAGMTKVSDSISGGAVVVMLSGGNPGVDYMLTCNISTSLARDDERSMRIRCRVR